MTASQSDAGSERPVIHACNRHPNTGQAHSGGLPNEREGNGKYATTSLRAADCRRSGRCRLLPSREWPGCSDPSEVPSEYTGQGIASQLAHGIFELLRETRRKAIPRCPFMGRFLVKNPQYSDIVAG